MEMTTTKVAGYMRVSTPDQAESGLGMAAQRKAIWAYAQAQGIREVLFIEDIAVHGDSKPAERPGMARLLGLIDRRQITTVLLHRYDRLSRDRLDMLRLLTVWKTNMGLNVVATSQGVPDGPEAALIECIYAGFAEYERCLISARTKEALAAAKASGVVLGPRPYKGIAIDIISRLRDHGDASLSYRAIATHLNGLGHPSPSGGKWLASTVMRVHKRQRTAALTLSVPM